MIETLNEGNNTDGSASVTERALYSRQGTWVDRLFSELQIRFVNR